MSAVAAVPPRHEEVCFDRPWTEEVVLVDQLRIDRTYQRDDKPDLVNRIGNGFDLTLARYIDVSRRKNDALYVIDGQQRTLGARKAGETEMLARVFEGLTLEEEAHLYDALNHTQPLNSHEKFKGAYGARRPDAIAIYNIVHSFDGSIMGIDGYSMQTIAAVSALQSVYQQGGDWGLTTTLSVIKEAFGEITRNTTPSGFLKAVHMAISRHSEEIDQPRLAKRISETGLLALKQRAVAFASRNADAGGYYIALLDAYNHKLTVRRRLTPIFRYNGRPSEDE